MTATYSEVLPMPTGMPSGRCAGVPDVMDPDPDDALGIEIAREVCMSCPVYVLCRAWADTLPEDADPGGVLAATTESERAAQRETADSQTCTECATAKPVVAFAFSDRVHRIRRRECRTCVNKQGRALGAVTAARNRAAMAAAAERVAA